MTDTNDLKIECPECGLVFVVPGELLGAVGTCASCHAEVPVVPMPERVLRYKRPGIFARIRERLRQWRAQD